MKDEPDIIKELREKEKLGELKNLSQDTFEVHPTKETYDKSSGGTVNVFEDSLKTVGKNIEGKYQITFENYAIAITLADEKERIISWNKYAEELLNMDEKDLFMKPVETLYPPEEWKKIRMENIREKGAQHNLETRMYKKNKELIDVDLSLSVFKNDAWEIIGSIGVINNITERKLAEKKLRESEKKYEGLFECTTDGMLVLDARGAILDVNNRALELLSVKEEEMISNNFLSMGLLTPKSLSIVVNQFQELLSKKVALINAAKR